MMVLVLRAGWTLRRPVLGRYLLAGSKVQRCRRRMRAQRSLPPRLAAVIQISLHVVESNLGAVHSLLLCS